MLDGTKIGESSEENIHNLDNRSGARHEEAPKPPPEPKPAEPAPAPKPVEPAPVKEQPKPKVEPVKAP